MLFLFDKYMKIGIYTLPLRYNYGGILQAWALQTVLKRMGHNVVTFDPCPYLNLSWQYKPIVYARRIIKKILGLPVDFHYERTYNMIHDIKMQNLQPFIKNNINRREFLRPYDLNPYDYDILIAGSDQVWRPQYNCSYKRKIDNAFFDFAECWDVVRIAYAVSFGTDSWEYSKRETSRCSKLAKLFAAISVREKSGIKFCEDYLGVNATHVLDPTLLLDRKDYEDLIINGQQTHAPLGNLLCYLLDETEDVISLVNRIAQEKQLIPFRANSKVENKDAPVEEKIQPPVEQWLRNFKDASFIVTDSFHACVFSVIFNKPFIVVGNVARGLSRYESFLSDLNLMDNLLYSVSDYDPQKKYNINLKTKTVLSKMRYESINFIKNSIS